MWTDYGFKLKVNNGPLSHWNNLLERWCLCIERFYNYSLTVPALNKEETHVGILSGAAWDLGLVGFQEMRRNRTGRVNYEECCDLYICDSTGIFEDYIECKKERLRDNYVIIANLMAKACHQVGTLILDDASEKARRIGVVFVDFEFSSLLDLNIDLNIQSKLDHLATTQYDAMAWSFPKVMRSYREENSVTGSGIILPGTVLLAKFIGNRTIIEKGPIA